MDTVTRKLSVSLCVAIGAYLRGCVIDFELKEKPLYSQRILVRIVPRCTSQRWWSVVPKTVQQVLTGQSNGDKKRSEQAYGSKSFRRKKIMT
jgi:hypothetical protein